MRIPRFYLAQDLATGTVAHLSGVAAHHAQHVLRIKNGDRVVVFNGRGGEYLGTVSGSDKQGVHVDIQAWETIERESVIDVDLIQAVSSGDKMDYAVQKAVELGVARIFPVLSERSVVNLKGERARKRVEHWQRIAISACEQCGRNRVPRVAALQGLGESLRDAGDGGARWVLSPDSGRPLSKMDRPDAPLRVLVGPEGGLTEGELEAARREGFSSMRLGDRILRTETAAAAVLAAIQALWGDF